MQPLCWANTVKLTLSIQHARELELLLQHNSLPSIEHLEVTNEDLHIVLPTSNEKSILNIESNDVHLRRERIDGIRLRYLLLRYINLTDIITSIDSLSMPVLETLILVDMYDHTLDHLGKFQELCSSKRLPALKNLHFSFCFPQQIEVAWQMSSFNWKDKWPFDSVDSYIDESYNYVKAKYTCIPQNIFIIYNHPIDFLIRHRRTFHNHHLVTHVSKPIFTTRRRLTQWSTDQKYESNQISEILRVLASGRVNELHLIYFDEQPYISTIKSTFHSDCKFWLDHLRSIKFDIKSESIEKFQRVAIVKQVLDVSMNLSHLVVEWNDFRHCSRSYSNLRHVHLVLARLYPQPKQHFHIDRLTQLAPQLCVLETSRAIIMFDDYLIEFTLNIIRRFDQLIHLVINKDGIYPIKHQIKTIFNDKLIAAGHGQVFDCNNIQIIFPRYNQLNIWL
ncbi:unnamed protein product [Rotaria sp. Silwood2]|nr:unnamed protein product [Rotaria sp. Silwood2]CAF4228910.1 unnamed protein product [Rotaria sp. Silwood2]